MELFSSKFLQTVTITNFETNIYRKIAIYLRLRVFNFFGHYCKGKVLIDIVLFRKFIFKVFVLSTMAFQWKQLLSLREKRVFPKKVVTVTSQVGVTYFKSCVAVLRIRGCLHWLNLFAGCGRSYHDRGFRGPERFVVVKSFYIIGQILLSEISHHS